MKLLVWGCGERCDFFLDNKMIDVEDVVAFVDRNESFTSFHGKQVIRPNQIVDYLDEVDCVLITIKERQVLELMLKDAKSIGIPDDRILVLHNYFSQIDNKQIHKQNDEVIGQISQSLFEETIGRIKSRANEFCATYRCVFDATDATSVLAQMNHEKYQDDYIRYRTIELLVNELEANDIEGDIAELGVFKGVTSRLLNKRMPDRQLYLFDSFESFKENEFADDETSSQAAKNARDELSRVFTYTNAEQVLTSMPHKGKCVIRQGFFPESLQQGDEDLRFAFVSLDVDLEGPTYEGLKYFYPRLSDGGYICIHDYNNGTWEGIKSAVARFEKDMGIKLCKVPLCDQSGTLVVTK